MPSPVFFVLLTRVTDHSDHSQVDCSEHEAVRSHCVSWCLVGLLTVTDFIRILCHYYRTSKVGVYLRAAVQPELFNCMTFSCFKLRNHLFWCCSQWLDWYNVV